MNSASRPSEDIKRSSTHTPFSAMKAKESVTPIKLRRNFAPPEISKDASTPIKSRQDFAPPKFKAFKTYDDRRKSSLSPIK